VELAQRENGSAGRIIYLAELKAGRRDLLRICNKSLFLFKKEEVNIEFKK
jgi:hypothetical protein